MRTRRATTVTALSLASLLAGATLLAGCGGGGDGGGTATSSSKAGSAIGEPSAGANDESASGGGGGTTDAAGPKALGSGTGNSARVVPITRAVVYHGDIQVRVKNVATAVARAEGLTSGVEGLVYAEETSSEPGRKGAVRATMTLKVPPTSFRSVLAQLGELGKQLSRSQNAEDVTSQAVDIESRLRSQRASVARLRALLDKATTVGAVVQVESELSQREADLEALEAQQKKLSELVDLATINVSFVAPDVKVAPKPEKSNLGFLSGLGGGWHALVAAALVALTVAGALLPFVITLALVGVPTWLVLRARRHHPAAAPVASDG